MREKKILHQTEPTGAQHAIKIIVIIISAFMSHSAVCYTSVQSQLRSRGKALLFQLMVYTGISMHTEMLNSVKVVSAIHLTIVNQKTGRRQEEHPTN